MNRRAFLRILAGAAPVAVVAPKYFFAPVGGWKPDVIINPYNERFNTAMRIIDDWMRRVEDAPTGRQWMFIHPAQAEVARALGFRDGAHKWT